GARNGPEFEPRYLDGHNSVVFSLMNRQVKRSATALAGAPNPKQYLLAFSLFTQSHGIIGVSDGLAVNAGNHIMELQSGSGGVGILLDAADEGAVNVIRN